MNESVCGFLADASSRSVVGNLSGLSRCTTSRYQRFSCYSDLCSTRTLIRGEDVKEIGVEVNAQCSVGSNSIHVPVASAD